MCGVRTNRRGRYDAEAWESRNTSPPEISDILSSPKVPAGYDCFRHELQNIECRFDDKDEITCIQVVRDTPSWRFPLDGRLPMLSFATSLNFRSRLQARERLRPLQIAVAPSRYLARR